MGAYKTVVVGTDGSDSSMIAVDRAGRIAGKTGAKLIVATAYHHREAEDTRAEDVLKDEGWEVTGDAPVYEILKEASDRAKAAGAKDIEERAIIGDPVHVLVKLAKKVHADLLVVGNLGMNTVSGRLLGSVPSSVTKHSKTDVLIVHTT
jgi:nucleotide-binding universal stress UspA family protein